jgi:phosphate transport system ATP-binding protein
MVCRVLVRSESVLTRRLGAVGNCPEIRAENISLRYKAKKVLDHVSFTVPAGQIMALVGPSGCGKTSFLTCINRLTDYAECCSVAGKLLVGDLDVLDRRVDLLSLRRQVGTIFQRPNPFPFSIWKNLEFPLKEHGVKDKSQLAERIQGALEEVGLWNEVKDRLHSSALQLSGGQQQRLCIARAIVLKPKALLMDEPCSALDPVSSRVVEELIEHLRGRYTTIVVTHNLAQARRIADQVAVFWVVESCGEVIEVGPTQKVFDSPRHPLTAAYVSGRAG